MARGTLQVASRINNFRTEFRGDPSSGNWPSRWAEGSDESLLENKQPSNYKTSRVAGRRTLGQSDLKGRIFSASQAGDAHAYLLAWAQAGLGKPEAMRQWIKAAIEEDDPGYFMSTLEDRYAFLWNDPEYQQLRRRMFIPK
jgi:hypothetical protein